MAYTPFNDQKPDPTVDNGTAAFTNTRTNLLALRDGVVTGRLVGWDVTAFNSAETGPPNDLSQIPVIRYAKGVERLRDTITWDGSSGLPTKIKVEYSTDSGSTYSVIGTENYTWDAGYNFPATSWT